MPTYAVFLHSGAASFFHSLRREEKGPLRRFFDLLEQYSTTEGEATERDAVGRTVQVKFVRRLKVVYWANHADKRNQGPAPGAAARRRGRKVAIILKD